MISRSVNITASTEKTIAAVVPTVWGVRRKCFWKSGIEKTAGSVSSKNSTSSAQPKGERQNLQCVRPVNDSMSNMNVRYRCHGGDNSK